MYRMFIVSIFQRKKGLLSKEQLLNCITIISTVLTITFIVYGIWNHLFSSQESLKRFLEFLVTSTSIGSTKFLAFKSNGI